MADDLQRQKSLMDMTLRLRDIELALDVSRASTAAVTAGLAPITLDAACYIENFTEDKLQILDALRRIEQRQQDIETRLSGIATDTTNLGSQVTTLAGTVASLNGSGEGGGMAEIAAHYAGVSGVWDGQLHRSSTQSGSDFVIGWARRNYNTTDQFGADSSASPSGTSANEGWKENLFLSEAVAVAGTEALGFGIFGAGAAQTIRYIDIDFVVPGAMQLRYPGAESITVMAQFGSLGYTYADSNGTNINEFHRAGNVFLMDPTASYPVATYPSGKGTRNDLLPGNIANLGSCEVGRAPAGSVATNDQAGGRGRMYGAMAITLPKNTFGDLSAQDRITLRFGATNRYYASLTDAYAPPVHLIPRADTANQYYNASPQFDARVVLNMPV